MSRRNFLGIVAAAALLAPTARSTAQQTGVVPEKPLAYKPPLRGAPSSRVGGGSRGTSDNMFVLAVIAPDHTGLTTQEQPTLYWYLSGKVSTTVEITLIDDVGVKPLLERTMAAPSAFGVQKLALSEFGVQLRPGIEYRWHIALVVDPAQRSNDILASATIRRELPSDTLRAKLANAQGTARVGTYASEGYWYDSLDSLMAEIQKNPADASLNQYYTSLLSQVGLSHLGSGR